MPRSLDTYRQKRDATRTPEPFGVAVPARLGARRFVVQQHSARRMHWDFRLEIDGVLASWAVPRGPSIDPKERRLAVQTEDHPLEYGGFEGIIPPGNYGAGAVIVWDAGTYESADGNPPEDGLASGKLDLHLRGHKLRGRWALVRIKRGNGREWLLFKKPERVRTGGEPVVEAPESVLSGLTVEELARGVDRTAELERLAADAGAERRELAAADLAPMLAETAPEPFSRSGWLFELKYDGIRALAVGEPQERADSLRPRRGSEPPEPVGGGARGRIRILNRKRQDIAAAFPEIAAAAAHLPCASFAIDGEIIALDDRGAGSFERLQRRLGASDPASVARAAAEVPVAMFCFDLLAVAGHDLRPLPLLERKRILSRLLPPRGILRFADHIAGEGEDLYRLVRQRRLEGMIAKRAASSYRSGRRSSDWLKVRAPRTADLAIVGFLPGKGSRRALGSLMLAWRGAAGLRYAGNVGSGLDEETIERLLAAFAAETRETPAFESAEKLGRAARFVEPRLVAEVRFTEATSKGLLRQPVFLRLRDDKEITACDPFPGAPQPATPPAAERAEPPSKRSATGTRQLALTNLDKVFWPGDGYTKGDLLAYHRSIWPHIAPYLRDRPVVLTRYPDGIAGKSFFQKDAPEWTPDWATTCRIEDTEYFVCNDLDTLLYVVNLGCIPLHVWSARRGSLERPDWAILDLDPKGAPFSDVVKVARHIHAVLAPLGVEHFVKTSGQDGLHILLPLGQSLDHDEAKRLAEVLARIVAAELPDIATVARPLGDRGGKVYVDFLQNGFGKTIAAPYSVRPRPGAPVSTPLTWREVGGRLDPTKWTILTVPARAGRRDDPLRRVLEARIDVPRLLAALGQRLRD